MAYNRSSRNSFELGSSELRDVSSYPLNSVKNPLFAPEAIEAEYFASLHRMSRHPQDCRYQYGLEGRFFYTPVPFSRSPFSTDSRSSAYFCTLRFCVGQLPRAKFMLRN